MPTVGADASLFNLPVQTNGADGFKLALCLISSGLEGMDARVVHTLHDGIIVEARDGYRGSGAGGREGVDGRGI